MRTQFLPILLALVLVTGTSNAFAGGPGEADGPEETTAAATGPYLGVGGFYAPELFDDSGAGGDADGSTGFRLFAGYRLHPNIAIEAIYEHYLEFDLDPGEIRGWSIGGNVKGFILTGDLQPYLLVGAAYLDTQSSNGSAANRARVGNGPMVRFGAGVDICTTDHITMGPRIEYALPFSDVKDLDFMTIGADIQYRF